MGGDAKPDLNDVKYDAFPANRRTLADPEIMKVEGRRLGAAAHHQQLRAMSAFHIELGELEGDPRRGRWP